MPHNMCPRHIHFTKLHVFHNILDNCELSKLSYFWLEVPWYIAYIRIHHTTLGLEGGVGGKVGNDGLNLPTFWVLGSAWEFFIFAFIIYH